MQPEGRCRSFSRLDCRALAGYCQAYGRWVEAERKVQESPVILKMPSGYIQQNPWLTIAKSQMELMQRFTTERHDALLKDPD